MPPSTPPRGPRPAIRAYRDSDADAVAALLEITPELPSTTADAFRSFAALSFNRNARDFRVLGDGAGVVGLLTSTLLEDVSPPLRHFRIVIHPSHRRRGLGTWLLDELRQQDTPTGTRLQCNSHRSWREATGFLESAGFRVARSELLMDRAGGDAVTTCPTGVEVRPATSADDDAWIALHHHGYGEREDFTALTAADLAAERASPGFGLVVAERGGAVVGLCHTLDSEPGVALINSVVVRRDAWGMGVGAALVNRAIAESQAKRVILNVAATNQRAIALYERLGFATYDEMRTYRRPMAP